MLSTLWNLFLVATAAAVAALFQLGLMAPGDAFFAAVAIVLVFTGQQLIAREGMGLFAAAGSLLAKPDTYGSRLSYLAYVACVGLGALVAVQVAVLAV